MARTESPDAKARRLLAILEPHLLQHLALAPDFGEVGLSLVLHDGEPGRIRFSAEVVRAIAPKADRGRA